VTALHFYFSFSFEVKNDMSLPISRVARSIISADRSVNWQRVNSSIADVLKDLHNTYYKLARLQGDFGDEELEKLTSVSKLVLNMGDELSDFSKAFSEGKYQMIDESKGHTTDSHGGEFTPFESSENFNYDDDDQKEEIIEDSKEDVDTDVEEHDEEADEKLDKKSDKKK
jgi:hypothetical protein